MPFTPFHFGPGLFLKATFRRHFSFVVFVMSQVLIDLEPGWNIVRGHYPVHGYLHTYLGSLLVVLICVLISRPMFEILGRMNLGQIPWVARLCEVDKKVTLRIVLASSMIGVWSHVFLDSIMHRDLVPFSPFLELNALLGACSLLFLHVGCVIAGTLGVIIWFANNRIAGRPKRS
jgi:hypothetical protein